MDTRADGGGIGRAVLAAAAFLTRLPIDRRGNVRPADVARGVVVFPVVGAAVGGIAAAVAWMMGQAFPVGVAAVGAVAVELILTGGLHVDGLADTFDSYGGDTRERALEIMRDHAIGAYGVAAITVDLLGKAVVIAALVERAGGLWMLVAAGAVSRATAGVLGSVVPYARPSGGTGGVLGEHGRSAWAVWAALIGLAVASASAGVRGLMACVAAAAAAGVWAWRCRRRLGGMTGDTLGAAVEMTEVIVLLVGLAYR
ncbi:MAG: adenosylcobinamide-GDP ribazoletransferase [Actinomycetota bacterium]